LFFFRLALSVVRSLRSNTRMYDPSLTHKPPRQPKKLLRHSFVRFRRNSVNVLFNPNCAPLFSGQGEIDRHLL